MNEVKAKSLLKNILSRAGVTDEVVLKELSRLARFKTLDRDEKIIATGQLVTHFYAIITGLARYYYISPAGKEWNKAFFKEGQLIGSLSAMLRRQPCNYTIAALEKSFLAAIPVKIFESELSQHQQIQMLHARSVQSILLQNEEREALLLTCNSEARYLWLLENQNWLVERVAQYHLASYLGMEPASLSRLKRNLGTLGRDR